MKYFVKIYLLVIVLTSFFSCDDPKEGSTYQIYDINPISTYLESRPDDFSEWITILKYTDLFNAINFANQHFTAFVPENDAVKSFYAKKGVNSIEELGMDYARNLALFHLIGDSITSDEFSKGGRIESATLSEDFLSVSFGDDGHNTLFVNKEALVLERANRTSNGFVYVLDGVLSPLTETVYDRIHESEKPYTILDEALTLTSWKDSLSVIADTIDLPGGREQIVMRKYTLLAVSDEAFRKDNISSVNDLINRVGAGNDYKNPENALFNYIAYHIIEGFYEIDDLGSFDSEDDKSKLWNTKAKNEVLQISEVDKNIYINYDGPKASFVEDGTNIVAKNGMVQEIDGYLPVWQPNPAPVVFDFCNYPAIASYIERSPDDPGQKYQTVTASNEYRTNIESLSCFTVKKMPVLNYNKYNAVDYFTGSEKNGFKEAKFGDQLILHLGYTGSIAMETPAIIKGKYKVTLFFAYATSMNFIRSATGGSDGGSMEFSFDDNISIKTKPYATVSVNTLGMYNTVLFEEVEFDATSTHNFKIVILDPAASRSSDYRIQLDYLLFEPI